MHQSRIICFIVQSKLVNSLFFCMQSAFQEDEDEKQEGSNSCLAKVTAGPTLLPVRGLSGKHPPATETALPSVGGPTLQQFIQQVRVDLKLGDGANTSRRSEAPPLAGLGRGQTSVTAQKANCNNPRSVFTSQDLKFLQTFFRNSRLHIESSG
jgi:hypothetical protein